MLGYNLPADYALLRLVVDENSAVTQYGIQTYKLQLRDENDEKGYILINKTTKILKPKDKIQFFTYAFNLNDFEAGEEWFEVSEVVEVTQEPEFTLELLELADESGGSYSFYYVMYGEDANGNSVITELNAVTGLADQTSDSDQSNFDTDEEGIESTDDGSEIYVGTIDELQGTWNSNCHYDIDTESHLKESITVLGTNIYINSNYFAESLCSESTYSQDWTFVNLVIGEP